MSVTTNGLFAITIGAVIVLCGANSQTRGFLGAASGVDADQPSSRLVDSSKVEARLRESLAAAMDLGGSVPHVQLASIEASLLHTFEALPKNDMGRLGPRAVRHIVYSYFAKEHGWIIKGLEPHGMSLNMSEMHEVSVLQDKAPALVEAMLEARELGRGLILTDVVAMVLTLEKLILGESTSLIETAYKFKELAVAELINEDVLHEVLVSYLLLFAQGSNANFTQRQWKAIAYVYMKEGGKGAEMIAFERSSVLKYRQTRSQQKNESEPELFSFTDVEHIVADLAQNYGKWQNGECQRMQGALKRLDTIGSGSVSLGAFFEQPKDAEYQFTESEAVLRQIGALDESVLGSPRVRIQNYVLGPSNCVASSVYYSVCCLNECEGMMNRIEDAIEAPEATPEQLRSIVAELSTTGAGLEGHLRDRLESIAAQGEGKVSLHGRLFAEWLHHAFPYECPYPAVVGADVLLPSPWTIEDSTAAPEERRQHIEAFRDSSSDASGDGSDCAPQWSDEEILPVHETQMPRRSAIGGFLRSLMQGLAFLVVLRVALGAFQSAMHVHQGSKGGKVSLLPRYC